MYEDLVKRLRSHANSDFQSKCDGCKYSEDYPPCFPCIPDTENAAADAIEEMSMRLHGDEAAIAGMKREIERMVVSGNKPRSISVEDRLPEKAGRYIVFVELKRDGQKISAWTQVTLFFGDFFLECPEDEECFVATVTHWMPLPEPPKEG